ncbi:unnamed protein product [Acanthoscelides obtectus]|uniref:Translocon-associated protein subunit delta n=1 Tax=Acanthoscelides obtectus TaxID=200917 RepID=A0A9P0JJQ7_ACAOB|nr:unnamed protein product [Acanthoscelides obtectus]CAK1628960.1 Translocon-associated protein subunit delta [Acanthoscelides obtectus]
MAKIVSLVLFSIFVSSGFCSSCSNLEVSSTSFTTQDATIVSKIGYISEFTVKCSSGNVGSLYAEVDNNIVPASVVGTNKYQVSWIEDPKTAQSGERKVRIFNEDGFAAYRKVLRAGECPSTVPELFTVLVNHPGAFSGPWLKSEFIATVVSLCVAYFAVASKAKLLE